MRRYRPEILLIGAITIWALWSWTYLGVEDGSSGLSPLGWLHVLFFVPGLYFLELTKGSHSNADLAFMAVLSWATWCAAGLLLRWLARRMGAGGA
jgi:hypothetical protein